MNESYIICFRMDENFKNGEVVVLEHDRNSDLRIVNVIYDIDIIADIYEQIIGREM